jgi:hypothetical protein
VTGGCRMRGSQEPVWVTRRAATLMVGMPDDGAASLRSGTQAPRDFRYLKLAVIPVRTLVTRSQMRAQPPGCGPV